MPDLPHLRISASSRQDFASPRRGGGSEAPTRNRQEQGNKVRALIANAEAILTNRRDNGAGNQATLAVSGPGLDEEFSRLQDLRTHNFVVASSDDDVVLVSTLGDLSALSKKTDEYLTSETAKGFPRHEQLIARIDDIRLATVDDLSFGEIREDDVSPDDIYFIEVWIRTDADLDSDGNAVESFIAAHPDSIRRLSEYRGMDRDILLVAIRGALLIALPQLTAFVAELHVPPRVQLREAANKIEHSSGLPPVDVSRIPTVVVAVHDTGLDLLHPLLAPILIGADTAVPDGSVHDWNGHGTKMAGLAVYGDLSTQVLSASLTPYARLVAIDYLAPGEQGDVLWAERTDLSIELADQLAREHRVVHNISMGAPNPREHEPTSWSVAVDRAAWNGGKGRLIVVSAGNTAPVVDPLDYPTESLASMLSQPAQSWNAITANGVTELDALAARDRALGVSSSPAARAGQLSPFSTAAPANVAPFKPDVAAEAGNIAPDGRNANEGLIGLSLLTTASRVLGTGLTRTNATSAAAALVTNALARIWAAYPDFTAASIRALLAHSSEIPGASLSQLGTIDARRALGNGAIDVSRALESTLTRPVLVFEGALRPRRIDLDGEIHRDVVLVRLPFPTDSLESIGDAEVRLDVTLSYFVEPSEAERRTKYAGARLRWDMQGPLESEEEFSARVNALARDDDYAAHSSSFSWAVGSDGRSRGSLQHDWTVGAASSYSRGPLVAIYPVLGWWDKKVTRANEEVPFSLVASLDAGALDIDLYTPIMQHLTIPVDLDVDVEVAVDGA